MKVGDFTNEGIGDIIGKVAQSWKARQQNKATAATTAQIQKQFDQTIKTMLDKSVYKQWQQFLVSQPGYQNFKPAELQQAIVNWANDKFAARIKTTQHPAPAIQNSQDSQSMYDYLYKRTQEYVTSAQAVTSAQTVTPAAGQQPATIPQKTSSAAAPQPASIQPGYRIKVVQPESRGIYYKTSQGWTNEIGEPITNPDSIRILNQMADSSSRLEPIPGTPTTTTTAKPVAKPIGKKKRRIPAAESIELTEGGNAIPSSEPVAKDDVANVVTLAKKYLPPQLAQSLQTDIGSAGYKVASGDIDLMVDAEEVVKFFKTEAAKDPILAAKQALKAYFENQGVESNVKGRNVHIGVKYRTRADNKPMTAQVDVMVIPEAGIVAPWHQHGLRGQYADPEFKGSDLFVLISSIAKAMNLKFDAFGGKLVNRDTGEVVARSRDDVAKILLNPRAKESDLDSVKSVLRALENDPDKETKLAQARQDAAKGVLRLPEVAPPGTAAWFNDRVNRLL